MKEQESSAQSGQLKADSMAVCKVTLFYWNHEKLRYLFGYMKIKL